MNPWIVITLVMSAIVFGIDYLLRKKKWSENSKVEKISLFVNMFSVGPYAFLSVLGMFWGIVPNSPETNFGNMIYDLTLTLGEIYFVIAIVAVISSLILRKKERAKASIWVNVIALVYIVLALSVNHFAGTVL